MPENEIFKLADRLKALDENEKATKAKLKEITAEKARVNQELSDSMINEEMQNFSKGGKLFFLDTKLHASAISDKKNDLFNNLKEQGFGDLIYETVNANSLSAFVKEQIEQNEDQLPNWLNGLVNVYEETKVGMRKAAK